MLSSSNTREPLRIEPKVEVDRGALSAAESLRLHWPEYLMEAGESGLYLFSACAVATFLWHPASPIQPYLPGDAVRRMLMGAAYGRNYHRDRPFTVGQAVWSTLQPRCHVHVSSIGESRFVGYGILLHRTTYRRGHRRCARLACASWRAGKQSGPLRHNNAGHLRRHPRVSCRTGHLVSIDERDPFRVQSQGAGAICTLPCRHLNCHIHRFRVSNIRYEHESRPVIRPSIEC
jgi:hypothetical protein